MTQKPIYDVASVEELLDCKKTTAYKIIKELNSELEALGSKTIKGKVPSAYFHKRYKGFIEGEINE